MKMSPATRRIQSRELYLVITRGAGYLLDYRQIVAGWKAARKGSYARFSFEKTVLTRESDGWESRIALNTEVVLEAVLRYVDKATLDKVSTVLTMDIDPEAALAAKRTGKLYGKARVRPVPTPLYFKADGKYLAVLERNFAYFGKHADKAKKLIRAYLIRQAGLKGWKDVEYNGEVLVSSYTPPTLASYSL